MKDIEAALYDSTRVAAALDAIFQRFIRSGRSWTSRIDQLLSDPLPIEAKITQLAECLQLNFNGPLLPDSLFVALEEVGAEVTFLDSENLLAFEALDSASPDCCVEYGEGREVLRWLTKTDNYAAMRRLSAVIPNEIREMAFAAWHGTLFPDVLLHLLAFRDYAALLRTNPVIASAWALQEREPERHALWSDPKLLREREAQLAEGARALLRHIGLPSNRQMLRVIKRFDKRFKAQLGPRQLGRLASQAGSDGWGRLSSVEMTIPYELLHRMQGWPQWPNSELIREMCENPPDMECLKMTPAELYEDTANMLRQTGRPLRQLGRIETMDALQSLHDRLAARGYEPRVSYEPLVFSVEAPIPPESGMQAITDHEALQKAAKSFRNCSAYYGERIKRGRYAIYTIGSVAMIGLEYNPLEEVWEIDQIFGPENKTVSSRINRRVRQWLKRSNAKKSSGAAA